jgi:hypothetical protein
MGFLQKSGTDPQMVLATRFLEARRRLTATVAAACGSVSQALRHCVHTSFYEHEARTMTIPSTAPPIIIISDESGVWQLQVQALCLMHSSGSQSVSGISSKLRLVSPRPQCASSSANPPPHFTTPIHLFQLCIIFAASVHSLCQRICRGTRVQLCTLSHTGLIAVVVASPNPPYRPSRPPRSPAFTRASLLMISSTSLQ